MTQIAEFQRRINTASQRTIAEHLRQCDTGFVPRLSARVDIDAYSAKLISYAVRFEAWHEQELVGLVAAYPNAELGEMYVTSVSVLERLRRHGVAAGLIGDCIETARSRLLTRIVLEVAPENPAGHRLYESLGFIKARRIPAQESSMLRMELKVGS
jgi:ribosomal protein S18 acetylase RimI-like enzyme